MREKKERALAELKALAEKSRTIMVARLEGLSASQLQQIRSALKGKAEIKVTRRRLAEKVLESKAEMKDYLRRPFALLFSQLEPFELAALVIEHRFPMPLKAGQIAPKELWLQAGPTDLPAGPIVSELTQLGVKVGIEGGKVVIRENALLAKPGQPISSEAASIAAKLELTPFSVSLEPLAAYDSKTKKVYKELRIDKEATLEQLKLLAQQAFKFALAINYLTKATAARLLVKAYYQACSLSALIK